MPSKPQAPKTLYGLTQEEGAALIKELGYPAYRAGQLLDWLYKKSVSSLDEAVNLPNDFKNDLLREYRVTSLEYAEEKKAHQSVKFLFRTFDGHLLESVLIVQQGRYTVCVSTQLGCKMACSFCASGKGPFGRNLSAGEIVEQVAQIQKRTGKKITNIVYMGMGEPLDNFDATVKSLEILEADWGFALGARRITVSTSGITPKIVEFVERNQGRNRLSISLHSSIEEKRNELVPINRKYNLKELVKTLHEMNPKLSRKITFEYTLIKDQNDSKEEALGVVKIAKPLDALVNIIPYNPIREMNYETPSQTAIKNFRTILASKGVRVIVRDTVGQDIHAACGQLRLDRQAS